MTIGQIARRLLAAVLCVAGVTSCGGSSAPPAPTAPSPSPEVTSLDPCGLIRFSASPAILNGADCPTSDVAVVLLNMRDRAGFAVGACSGTVISERAILTAAHCLSDGVALVRVFLGTGLERVAQSFTAHPAYRGDVVNDVGVVMMSEPIGRRPSPLLLARNARVGETALIAGWGRNQNDVPATLRAGVTTITGADGTQIETQFGTNVASVCSGDSGGPVLLREEGAWAIAGVISATSANVCNTGTNHFVALRNEAVSSFILQLVPDAARR
jgi:hypothetical protein